MIKDKFKIDVDTAYVEGSNMEKYAIMIYILVTTSIMSLWHLTQ